MQLKEKIIIITGASQGLGECLAYKVTAEGAVAILVARTEKLLKKVKTTIEKKKGKAEYFVCDIRDLKQVQQTVKEIKQQFPKIDALVNNAGIWTDDSIEEKNPERRKVAVETNALGNIQFTKEVLPLFKNQGFGYIFNVISTAGVSDIKDGDNSMWQTYGASKWAMTGFTKALKESLENTKVKVSAFFPGGFESNLYENAGRPNAHKQVWMMKTEDVADVIIFALTRPDDVLLEKIVVSKVM